ncbi:MAG: pyruvate:ferredoxin (flavodoxin) oxidoreductase [Planctomycetes bacterium]|nr:pyruvate:ferredoxin (flavodoxin) oxidoreductase [Planctomycetota bacterium]
MSSPSLADPASDLSHRATQTTVDGNEATASVAYRLSDVAAIYPITPSSTMGELADEWASKGRTNLWGAVPRIVEMQSEGGAAGTVHGALTAGALATTFTASQGLLLMVPNLYKIAGELTPFVIHVAARTIATHALSIFGDHSDVMACRQTGFAVLASASVQEAQDMAAVAHAATLKSRVPFLHFFDGFRTSHEVQKIVELADAELRALIDESLVTAHRDRALTPDRPTLRGTAQNPDAFFQAREACNLFHARCPAVVEATLERFAELTGRRYRLFEYSGHPQAERVIVVMGSGAVTAKTTAEHLARKGERVGVVQVRLYRPFAVDAFLDVLPRGVNSIAVLDRTKEPGAPAEPLCLDVIAALRRAESRAIRVIGGRYGLSSKEFTPAMVKAVFDELARPAPQDPFTVGIVDDVTRLSLRVDESFALPNDGVVESVFFGLGSDGTVGANKNSIRIIGEETDEFAQGYFVYDSKKSGAVTISHLRFSTKPIDAPYLITQASFVACHQFGFLDRYDVLAYAAPGAKVLLNTPHAPGELWDTLPREMQEQIVGKRLKLFTIDANAVAKEVGLGGRINTIMQTCFFALSGVLPRDEAIACIKHSIQKSYGKKGDLVVKKNHEVVDKALDHLHEVAVPARATATRTRPPILADGAPDFVKRVTGVLMAGHGDLLPVSAFPVDGTWPTDTARWEKRAIANEVPVWDPSICIQCNKCALVCPHAAIRAKVYDEQALAGAPTSFRSQAWRGDEFPGSHYTIQVAPDDCTGCSLCTQVCPAKDKANPRHKAIDMTPIRGDEGLDTRTREQANFGFFLDLPEVDRRSPKLDVRGSQLLRPLFEFSGACGGCGETPYLKLLSQLFGDRLLIANATGCSSIFGGNLPTTPWAKDGSGRGPAWANSLFEDNAEFGLGFRLAVDALGDRAQQLVRALGRHLGDELTNALLAGESRDEAGAIARRAQVATLRERLARIDVADARALESLADWLVRKSVWLVGGDGWAFDIGYGGLDHVLSMEHDVNVLVLDTEVYSNTGGQASKATPVGASAKFAILGKPVDKKDLGLMALHYGHVYVASVAWGAKDAHTVRVFREAEAYPGPSLIIAYSPCIAHGYDLAFGADQQKRAVQAGVWPLYRYDPRAVDRGEPPLVVDAPGGSVPVAEYMRNEARFRVVEKIDPAAFRRYGLRAQTAATRRMAVYEHISKLRFPQGPAEGDAPSGDGGQPKPTDTE